MQTLSALIELLTAQGTAYQVHHDVTRTVNYPVVATVHAATAVHVYAPEASKGPLLCYDADGQLIASGLWEA